MSTPRPPHHSGLNESACTACNQYSVHVSNQQSVWHQSSSKTMKSVHRECTTTAQPSICWVLKCATNCKLLLCTANEGAGKRTSQRCYISGQTTHIEPCMSTPRPPHHSGLNESACTACNHYSVHVSNQQSVWHQSSRKTMKSVHRECTTTAQPSICWVLKCATNCKLLLCTANDGAGKRTSQRCYINGQTTHIEPCMSTPRPPHHGGLNESACTACNQYSVHVTNQQSVWHQSSSKTMKSVHRECTTTAQPSICWVLKCATNCKLLLCTANDGAGKRTSQRCYINGQTTHLEPCMSTPRPPHHSGLNESACTACNQYSVHVSNQQSVWHQSSSKTMKSVHRECTTTAQPSICWVLKCATNCKLLLCTANDGAGKRTSQRCYINGQTTHIEPCMSTPRPPHHSGRNESACTACNQYSVHVTNQQSVWHQSSSKTMKSVHRECTTTAQPSICWVLKCATNCKLLLCTANDGAGKRTSQRCYINGQTTHIEPCMSTPRPPHHGGLNESACTACNQYSVHVTNQQSVWHQSSSKTMKSVHRECTTTAQPSICWVLKCATNCKLLLCTANDGAGKRTSQRC